MSCIYCGAFTDPNQTICEKCRRNPEVTVLPPAERENFNGLTIEQDLNGNEYHRSQELDPYSDPDPDSNSSSNPNPHVYVRHINLGSSGGWLTKLIIAGVFLVIILVALPLALLLLLCFIIGRFLIKPKRH